MLGVAWKADAGARIGASVTIAAIASDRRLAAGYPGLAATAAGLATPQIRHLATLGGNLAQRSRCWYYRNPDIVCQKKGGAECPARAGNHLYGVAFDLGPCVAPHPSSMAAALMAYEAAVTTDRRHGLTIQALLGDGSSGTSDHALQPGERITVIELPPPAAGERAKYKRAISRAYAEWPLVEVVAAGCRRRCACADPANGRRTRDASCTSQSGNDRASGANGDHGRQPTTNDRVQGRFVERACARRVGAVSRVMGVPGLVQAS
jgi:xanthine dehydrogenase YagS FAD-binding subunit